MKVHKLTVQFALLHRSNAVPEMDMVETFRQKAIEIKKDFENVEARLAELREQLASARERLSWITDYRHLRVGPTTSSLPTKIKKII